MLVVVVTVMESRISDVRLVAVFCNMDTTLDVQASISSHYP